MQFLHDNLAIITIEFLPFDNIYIILSLAEYKG